MRTREKHRPSDSQCQERIEITGQPRADRRAVPFWCLPASSRSSLHSIFLFSFFQVSRFYKTLICTREMISIVYSSAAHTLMGILLRSRCRYNDVGGTHPLPSEVTAPAAASGDQHALICCCLLDKSVFPGLPAPGAWDFVPRFKLFLGSPASGLGTRGLCSSIHLASGDAILALAFRLSLCQCLVAWTQVV